MKTFVFVLLVSVMMPFVASAQIDFESGIGVPHIGAGYAMAVGDFDGNAQQDVVFAATPNTLVVYYSIGTDLIQKTFDVSASKIAVGDINDDGKDDIVIIDQPLGEAANLRKCTSTGTDFDIAEISTLEQGTWSMILTDHDGDNNVDLLLLKKFGYLTFHKGDGTGNFVQTEDSTLPYGGDGSHIVCSDFNNDGKEDLLIKGFVTTSLYLKNNDNEFELSSEFGAGNNFFSETSRPVVADFNGDNFLDLVAIVFDEDGDYILLYFANNATGGFEEGVALFDNPGLRQADHADYDGDGNQDLAVANYMLGGPPVILHNVGNATFEDASPTDDVTLEDIAFVNLDGIDAPEIIALSSNLKISVFKDDGSSYVFDNDYYFGTKAKEGLVFDLDNDGFDDLVSSSYNGVVTVWYGKGDGEFEEPLITKFSDDKVNTIAIADFNGDGYGDIALSATGSAMMKTYVMFSESERTYRADEIEASEAPSFLIAADFNNDGNVDFASDEKTWINNGDETFTSSPGIGSGLNTQVFSMDKGNFNDDEFPDLAVAGNSANFILYNDGTGVFTAMEDLPSVTILELHTTDLNNDGLDDLITFNAASSSLDLILLTRMAGGGFDETHIQENGTMYVNAINAADIDGDAVLDIIFNYETGLGVFRGKVEGGYEPMVIFNESSNVGNIALANKNGLQIRDINNDGRKDVVIFSLDGSPATIVLQETINEPTVEPTISAVGESSSAVITLTPGNGTGRLLIVRKESSGAATAPEDNTIYELNASNGDVYVHMTSTENTLSISDLEPNASYVATAFEYATNFSQSIIDYFPTGATVVFSTRKYQVITVTPGNPRPLENAAYTIEATSSAGLPLTYTLVSGNGTLTENVYTPNGPGSIHVEIVAEGSADYEPTSIEINQCIFPLTPVISLSDDAIPILTSSASSNNSWEHNGTLVPGAINKTYTPDQDGVYRCIVSVDGCTSYSEFTPFITTGLEDESNDVSLSPNPATNVVMISNFYGEALIYNSVGKPFSVPATSLSGGLQLNTSDLHPGLYIVRLQNRSLKFVKQ